MKVTANFATHKARKDVIDQAVSSIIDQVDEVRVHYNDYKPTYRGWKQFTGPDLTDKGKFAHIGSDEIAFTCDDDLLYPPDYVSVTLQKIYKYKKIITYHGRKLTGRGRNYYRGHESFHFMHTVIKDVKVDVPGTGVTAFDTRQFNPDILQYPQDKMVDILFALEAKKNKVGIICSGHPSGWILPLTDKNSIYSEMVNDCEEQNRLADQLLSIS